MNVDLCEIYRLWNMYFETELEIGNWDDGLENIDAFKFWGWDIEYLMRTQYGEEETVQH